MKLFVIHRFVDRVNAKNSLNLIAKDLCIDIEFIYLDSSGNEQWKKIADKSINESEAVIVFNPSSCSQSPNAQWEIDLSNSIGKKIVDFFPDEKNEKAVLRIKSLFGFEEEFNECFSKQNPDVIELYKIMIDTSEALIQRRQKTNAFFITAIGSILAIAGVLVKSGTIVSDSFYILYAFSAVGLLLCNSWRNLIDNYGKLNSAKYEVILRLEKELDAQIFSAEWIALGKGLRPKKYRSFTSTEKNVPLFFGLLITVLTIFAVAWQIWG